MFSCSCLFIKCTIFILLLSFDIETCNSSKPHCFEVTHTKQFTPFLNMVLYSIGRDLMRNELDKACHVEESLFFIQMANEFTGLSKFHLNMA